MRKGVIEMMLLPILGGLIVLLGKKESKWIGIALIGVYLISTLLK